MSNTPNKYSEKGKRQGLPSKPTVKVQAKDFDRSWHNPSKEEAEPIYNHGLSKASWYNARDFPLWLAGAVDFIERYSRRVPAKIEKLQVDLSMMAKNCELEEAKVLSLRAERKRIDVQSNKDIDFMERYQDFAFPTNGKSGFQPSSSVEAAMWKDEIEMERCRKTIQHNKISENLKGMKQRLCRISILLELTSKQIDDYESYLRLASSLSGLIQRIIDLKDIHIAHPTYKTHYHVVYQIFIQLGGNKANLQLVERHVTTYSINSLTDLAVIRLAEFFTEYRENRQYFPGNTDHFAMKLDEAIPVKNIWNPLYDASRSTLAEKNAVRHTVLDIIMMQDQAQGIKPEVELQEPEGPLDIPRKEKNRNGDISPDVTTTNQVLTRLEQDMYGTWFELQDLLSQFFVSPDIAPIFITMISHGEMSGDDFLDLTNSLINKKLQRDELEAFLIWCDQSDFLFKHSPEKKEVYLCPKLRGWEFVHEMPVAGSAREGIHITPLKTRAIEERLISHQKLCKLDTYGLEDRIIPESDIVTAIDIAWEEKPLEQEEIHNVLQYWHNTGRMFTMLEKRTPKCERLYKRLDNGWPPLPHNLHAPTNRSEKPYEYIQNLIKTNAELLARCAFIQADGRSVTESDLYSMLKSSLVYKVGTFGSVEEKQITRHDFHKFLRWCNDQRCLFWLWRDSTVELVEKGWEKEAIVEDGEENLYDA